MDIAEVLRRMRMEEEGEEFFNNEALELEETTESDDDGLESYLLQLTPDALATVMLHLSLHDVLSLSQTCKRMQQACSDDARIWRPMCESRWGSVTNPAKWVQAARAQAYAQSFTSMQRTPPSRSHRRSSGNGHARMFGTSPCMHSPLSPAGSGGMEGGRTAHDPRHGPQTYRCVLRMAAWHVHTSGRQGMLRM